MERVIFVCSAACFAASFLYSVGSLAMRRYRASRKNYVLVALGFAFLTAFLHLRGQITGHCPVTNSFEVYLFLGWSIALIYLVVGTGYRMSLLGAFTSPVVIALQAGAVMSGVPAAEPGPERTGSVWLEFHAAFSVVAYGAFALAAVAGVMYLMQESRLKSRHVTGLTPFLPPIRDLGAMNTRLMFFGFILLSAGLAAGFFIGRPTAGLKLAGGAVVWVCYAVILQSRWLNSLAPKTAARLSILAFGASLLSLWGAQLLQWGGTVQ